MTDDMLERFLDQALLTRGPVLSTVLAMLDEDPPPKVAIIDLVQGGGLTPAQAHRTTELLLRARCVELIEEGSGPRLLRRRFYRITDQGRELAQRLGR